MRPTTAEIRSMGDFAQVFRWNLSFSHFPNSVQAPPSLQAMNLRAETVDQPKRTNQAIDLRIRGMKIRRPGISEVNTPLTFQFVETVDNTVLNFIKQWREACWAPNTGAQVNFQDLEATIEIILLDNTDTPRWKYTLIGCFLEDYEGGGSLDGATSDFLKPQMMISYDDFVDEQV